MNEVITLYMEAIETFKGFEALGRRHSARMDFGMKSIEDIARVADATIAKIKTSENKQTNLKKFLKALGVLGLRFKAKGTNKVPVNTILKGLEKYFFWSHKVECILPHSKWMNGVCPSRRQKEFGNSMNQTFKTVYQEASDTMSDGNLREHSFIGNYEAQELLGTIAISAGQEYKDLPEEVSLTTIFEAGKVESLGTSWLIKQAIELANEHEGLQAILQGIMAKLSFNNKGQCTIKTGARISPEEASLAYAMLNYAGNAYDFDRPLKRFSDEEGEEWTLLDLLSLNGNNLKEGNISSLTKGLVDDMFSIVKQLGAKVKAASRLDDKIAWATKHGYGKTVTHHCVTERVMSNNLYEELVSDY